MRGLFFALASLSLTSALSAAAARADAPPLRHLVYSFNYESSQNGSVTSEPGSSGNRSFSTKLDDHGTVTLDVLREAPDRGLVVVISEQGTGPRRAAAATCAVYGNTTIVCDPGKQVNGEEYTLLRFLGANFYDPNMLDAKQHWSISVTKDKTKVTADYTVTSNVNGLLKIDETRHVDDNSTGSITVNSQTKLEYAADRLLPTSIDEYAIEEQHSGIIGISKTTYQTTFNLVSDSMAKTSP
ncbi:MAG TPA: hypothetical protein VHR97_08970 [Candidatus Baltobacteraceae bacterium]|jgi:hypothetical protein|nr:hypothetical protein [Candidatus Baltobacteraceae bacterium]